MGSIERRGPWDVPQRARRPRHVGQRRARPARRDPAARHDDDRRSHVTMGNVELIVPPELTVAARHDDRRAATSPTSASRASRSLPARRRDPRHRQASSSATARSSRSRRGETKWRCHAPQASRPPQHRHHRQRERHRRRWRELHAEREMWMRISDRAPWLAAVVAAGADAPPHLHAGSRSRSRRRRAPACTCGPHHHWWHVARRVRSGSSMMSGAMAWRLTRPLIIVVQAARDIGDGKLDTRLDRHQRGEMQLLATAINDMADADRAAAQRSAPAARRGLARAAHAARPHARADRDRARHPRSPRRSPSSSAR